MQFTIITIFCHVDDFLKHLSWKDHPQSRLLLSEIITIVLVASRFFGSNIEAARVFLSSTDIFPKLEKAG